MDVVTPTVDWVMVVRVVRKSSAVASYSDPSGRGMLLLHFVCALDPPLEPVRAILKANPRAVSYRGHTGLTPLHIACGRNASPAVLRCLIQQDPGALSILDNEDQAAVHYACRPDVNHQVLRVLLTERPLLSAVRYSDGSRNTGLRGTGSGLLVQSRRNRQEARQGGTNNNNSDDDDEDDDTETNNRRNERRGKSALMILCQDRGNVSETSSDARNGGNEPRWSPNQWQKVMHWLFVAHFGTLSARNGQTLSILHASLAQNAPPEIVNEALRIAPNGFCGVRDIRGNMPLHYAVKSRALRGTGLLQTILRSFPQAASATDAVGRLPLHEGLRSGLTWTDGLSDVFAFYPAAVTKHTNGAGEVPPVCLAASNSDLETTFLILQAYPQVLLAVLS